MKRVLMAVLLSLVVVGCGEKKPTYPIYTLAEKRKIYREAEKNNDEKKIKELEELKNRLELEWKKNNDATAFEEYADWDAVLKGL